MRWQPRAMVYRCGDHEPNRVRHATGFSHTRARQTTGRVGNAVRRRNGCRTTAAWTRHKPLVRSRLSRLAQSTTSICNSSLRNVSATQAFASCQLAHDLGIVTVCRRTARRAVHRCVAVPSIAADGARTFRSADGRCTTGEWRRTLDTGPAGGHDVRGDRRAVCTATVCADRCAGCPEFDIAPAGQAGSGESRRNEARRNEASNAATDSRTQSRATYEHADEVAGIRAGAAAAGGRDTGLTAGNEVGGNAGHAARLARGAAGSALLPPSMRGLGELQRRGLTNGRPCLRRFGDTRRPTARSMRAP